MRASTRVAAFLQWPSATANHTGPGQPAKKAISTRLKHIRAPVRAISVPRDTGHRTLQKRIWPCALCCRLRRLKLPAVYTCLNLSIYISTSPDVAAKLRMAAFTTYLCLTSLAVVPSAVALGKKSILRAAAADVRLQSGCYASGQPRAQSDVESAHAPIAQRLVKLRALSGTCCTSVLLKQLAHTRQYLRNACLLVRGNKSSRESQGQVALFKAEAPRIADALLGHFRTVEQLIADFEHARNTTSRVQTAQ